MSNPEPVKNIRIELFKPEPVERIPLDDEIDWSDTSEDALKKGKEIAERIRLEREMTARYTQNKNWVNGRQDRIDQILSKTWREITTYDIQWWIDEGLVIDSGLELHRELWAAMCVEGHQALVVALHRTSEEMREITALYANDKTDLPEVFIQLLTTFNRLGSWLADIAKHTYFHNRAKKDKDLDKISKNR